MRTLDRATTAMTLFLLFAGTVACSSSSKSLQSAATTATSSTVSTTSPSGSSTVSTTTPGGLTVAWHDNTLAALKDCQAALQAVQKAAATAQFSSTISSAESSCKQASSQVNADTVGAAQGSPADAFALSVASLPLVLAYTNAEQVLYIVGRVLGELPKLVPQLS